MSRTKWYEDVANSFEEAHETYMLWKIARNENRRIHHAFRHKPYSDELAREVLVVTLEFQRLSKIWDEMCDQALAQLMDAQNLN
jgi:hypothetical protein